MSATTCLSFDAVRWHPSRPLRAPLPAAPAASGDRAPAGRLPLSYAASTPVQAPQVAAWPGLSVAEWTVNGDRVDSATTPSSHLALMVRAGRRHEGESRLGGSMRSSLRDLAGTVTIVPAGTTFTEWHRPATSLRLLAVSIDPSAAFLQGSDMTPSPRLLEPDPGLGATMLKLRALLEGGGRGDGLLAETLAMLLLLEMSASRPRPGPARGGLSARQRRLVCEHIEAHLDEEISLGTLAAIAGVSPYHLCRAFKTEMGLPPHRWQIRRRIERAKELLAEPRWTVTEVGFDLGFGSSSHFAHRFRQETGMTPSEFRRSLSLPQGAAAIG